MPMRTFLAVDIDDATRSALAEVARHIDTGDARIRWVPPQNLHVTMNFLGDVPDEMLGEVCELSRLAAAEIEPFEFTVCNVLSIPPKGRKLRMFWADVDEPTGRIVALHEKLSAALSGMGLKEENRRYRPHVTLARIRYVRDADRLREFAQSYGQQEFGRCFCDAVTVYTSELTPDGAVYTPIASAPLTPAR